MSQLTRFYPQNFVYLVGEMRAPKENTALFQQILPYKMRKGDLRKIEIIEAAIHCIGNIGVENLTFEAVGKKSRIGKSHVVYHFPKLDDLIFTSVRYAYAIGQGVVSEFIGIQKNRKDMLRAYIEGTFHWMDTHPDHVPVAGLLVYFSTFDKRYRKLQTELRDTGRARVLAILKTQKSMQRKTPRQLKFLSEAIHAQLMGNILRHFAGESPSIRASKKNTMEAVEILLSN